ncbi:hypothetical protein EDD15DRAFT_2194368 [Pisolithus albus]|nr:hypothetical protein EDD15DRAFT_2194368 [Pisolithus albus]
MYAVGCASPPPMLSVTSAEAVKVFISAIHPSFDFILASTALSASLFTLLVALFVFSTKESRCRVVFRLNVFAICLALTLGVLIGLACGKVITDPFNHAWEGFYVAAVAFALCSPLLYDSILLTRLIVLYPIANTPSVTLVKIFAFPFCVKCARIVVLILFLDGYTESGYVTKSFAREQDASWYRNPKITAEWILQMADNFFRVCEKIHRRLLPLQTPHQHVVYSKGWVPSMYFLANNISERIRQMFYISVANFVFPLLFNIAQIILITTDRHPTAGAVVVVINNYVTLMGVLCATLWFSGSQWVRTRNQQISGHRSSHESNSERTYSSAEESGSEISVMGKDFGVFDSISARNSRRVTTLGGKDSHASA